MVEIGRIGKFHELTPGSDGKLYSGRIQVRTEIRHGRPLRLLGKQDRADNPLPSAFQLSFESTLLILLRSLHLPARRPLPAES